jgi:hypothetical protein
MKLKDVTCKMKNKGWHLVTEMSVTIDVLRWCLVIEMSMTKDMWDDT